jgi:hypothetical protein
LAAQHGGRSRVNGGRSPKASRKVIAPWVDLLVAEGQASSYPMRLRARWSDEHGTLPAESLVPAGSGGTDTAGHVR